jgi:starch phosphorylase
VNAEDEIMDGQATPMQAVGAYQEECCLFEATAPPCQYSGRHGYTVRVLPYHPDLTTSFVPGLIVWASA